MSGSFTNNCGNNPFDTNINACYIGCSSFCCIQCSITLSNSGIVFARAVDSLDSSYCRSSMLRIIMTLLTPDIRVTIFRGSCSCCIPCSWYRMELKFHSIPRLLGPEALARRIPPGVTRKCLYCKTKLLWKLHHEDSSNRKIVQSIIICNRIECRCTFPFSLNQSRG
jgi:hypothetical protein